jgi:uncharacterized protein
VHLEFVEDLGAQGGGWTPVHRYRFPPQEVSFSPGKILQDLTLGPDDPCQTVGTVHACDAASGILDIKKRGAATGHHPLHVHLYDRVTPKPLDSSLLDFARWVNEHGMDATAAKMRAGRDLLLRLPPRTRTERAELLTPKENSLEAALDLARDLDSGLLAIQGPPGAGKTHTGARMILGLARDGHRIGISATSHKVIRNLLDKVLEAAREEGVDLRVAHKPKTGAPKSTDPPPAGLQEVNKPGALAALAAGKVVGGTAWLWASTDCAPSVRGHRVVDGSRQGASKSPVRWKVRFHPLQRV